MLDSYMSRHATHCTRHRQLTWAHQHCMMIVLFGPYRHMLPNSAICMCFWFTCTGHHLLEMHSGHQNLLHQGADALGFTPQVQPNFCLTLSATAIHSSHTWAPPFSASPGRSPVVVLTALYPSCTHEMTESMLPSQAISNHHHPGHALQ